MVFLYWLMYWMCLGLIWSWYGELEYADFGNPTRTGVCGFISTGINIVLFPVAIWFGFFVYSLHEDKETAHGIVRKYNLKVNFIKKVKKTGLSPK